MRISDWSSDVCSSDLFIRAKARRVGVEIRCVLLLVAGKIGVHPIGRLSVGIARWLTLGVVLYGRRALAHCSVFLLRPTTCLPYRITRYRTVPCTKMVAFSPVVFTT